MEHDLNPNDFWHKIKMYNFDPYNALLAIATNIPALLMTVLQGHIFGLFIIWKTLFRHKEGFVKQVLHMLKVLYGTI